VKLISLLLNWGPWTTSSTVLNVRCAV